VRRKVAALPPDLDYCAVEPTLLGARDSGEMTYVPFTEGGVPRIAVQTPVYRSPVTPSTVSARRRTFVGWLGESLVPKVLLTAALQGRAHMAVTLRYRVGGRNATFTSGPAPAYAQTRSIDLHSGWTVQSFAPAAADGLFADRSALERLGGGALLSLLAAVLTFVLTTGRRRTSELAYQAQHDSLTGLPNRALVLEHAARLLAEGHLAAVMFIDVDGFKQVNDGFGHAAGDALLKAVAGRLRAAIRLQDIVARLGGDEFVVLLDSSAGDPHAEVIAQRIVQSVREPIRLRDGMVVSVGASVGLSMRQRASVSEVLNDADVAVYAAKAAGKGCYRVFRPGMQSDITDQANASAGDAGAQREAARSGERGVALVA
jgi:diguanylate cyclase (GGDEF)-like protein